MASEPPSVYGHLQCKLCKKHICFSCCTELHNLLTQFTKKRHILLEEKHAILTNPWYINVHKLLLDPLAFNNTTIPVGHCCSFTSTIGKSPPAISISLPKSINHHIPNEIFSTGNSSDSDSEYLPHNVIQKKTTSAIKHKSTNNPSALDFLHLYHDDKKPSPLLPHGPPLCPIKVIKLKYKRAKARGKTPLNHLIHHRYLGALVLHQFGIALLAQADNNNLRTDVVSLGISPHLGDESPPVWHHGIDLGTARI